MSEEELSNEKWQAIICADAIFDGKFVYAVITTGIFCKPSCKSKIPKKSNVIIFQNENEAIAANFRPCKRCRPIAKDQPDQEWAIQIREFIELNYKGKITLKTLSDVCHGSPFHLQRTFKKVIGMTPVEFVQQIRMNKALEYLIHSNMKIADIAVKVGMSNTYFNTLFKKTTGYSPARFRQIKGVRTD